MSLLVMLAPSCTEPFQPVIEEGDLKPGLVVEGQISNETGPFRVKLTTSVPIYANRGAQGNDHSVPGADVHIIDDSGNDFVLSEYDYGWYETVSKDLKGKPGSTYTLFITTPDGMQYQSSPQKMMESPPIDSVYFEEYQTTSFDGPEPVTENRMNILVGSEAPENVDTYLQWHCEETWEFHMPERIMVDHGPPSPNGFSYEPPSNESISIDESNEKVCWITENTKKILVASTTGYKDRKVDHFILLSIGPPDDKLNVRYSILVKQYAINAEIYNLLRKLRDANTETSGMYGKIPGQILGNITCCNNGEKELGYFIASAVQSKRIFIGKYDHHVDPGSAFGGCAWTTVPALNVRHFLYGSYDGRNVWSANRYCTDCSVRGTSIKPDFW